MRQQFILLLSTPPPPNERGIKEVDVLLFMVQLPSLFHPQSQQEDRSHHPCGGRGDELVKWACDRLYYCLRDGCRVLFCVSHSGGDIDLLPDRGPSLWGLAQLYTYMWPSHLNHRVVGWASIDACQHISCPKTWNWVDMSCRVIRHAYVGQCAIFYLILWQQVFKKCTIVQKIDFFQRRMAKIGVKLKGIKAVMCFLLMWKISSISAKIKYSKLMLL